jgi:hypothetical protein
LFSHRHYLAVSYLRISYRSARHTR